MLWSDEPLFELVLGENKTFEFSVLRQKGLSRHLSLKCTVYQPMSVMMCVGGRASFPTGISERDMLPSRQFSQEVCGYFSERMSGLILHVLQQHDSIHTKVHALHWPGCSPDLLLEIMTWGTREYLAHVFKKLRSSLRQEWANIPLVNCRNQYPKFPNN